MSRLRRVVNLLKKLQNMRVDNIRLEERCHMRCAFDNFFPSPGNGLRELISVLVLYAIELSRLTDTWLYNALSASDAG